MHPIYLVLLTILTASSTWAAELLNDPARSDTWALEVTPGTARATLRSEAGALRVDVTAVGQEAWHIQLLQRDRSLQPGKHFVLSFTAKASSPRHIFVSGAQSEPQFEVLWPARDLELSTDYRAFSFDVTVPKDPNGRLRIPDFMLGDKLGAIWIRDVTLRDPPAAAFLAAPPNTQAQLADDGIVSANDARHWTLEQSGTAQAEVRQDEGGIRIDVTRAGTSRELLQLLQANKRVTPGERYVLRFQVKAIPARRISIIPLQQMDASRRILAGPADIDLTETWKQYAVMFTAKPEAVGNLRVPVLQIGDAVGTIWFRNATLSEAK